MKTVLAVAYGGGHIACLLPVIERLRAAGDIRVEVLALTTAADACVRHGIPHRRFADFPMVQDERSRAHGTRLVAATQAHPTVPVAESVAYLGASYRDLEDALGVPVAAERFANDGRQAFLPVASLATIIAEIRPDVVLTTSAPRAERAAVIAAARAGVPAVVVVDLFGYGETGWLRESSFGAAVCVLNAEVRARLIAAGRPAEHLHVTGNPVFDRLGDPALATRAAQLRAAHGWGPGVRVITWASQPEPADPQVPRRVEAALLAALGEHPDWHLVIRPHPSDSYVLPPTGPQVTVSGRQDDLHALLAASDVVVTMTSTVGLEAILAGTPLVTWDLSQNTHDCPYAAMGLSAGVRALPALAPTIAEVLAGGGPKPALPAVGGATERVVDQVRAWLA